MRAAILTLASLTAIAIASCKDYSGKQEFACPSHEVFTGVSATNTQVPSVSAFMERRCGTLDCHGSQFRPFRLMGQHGLRSRDEGNVPGGKATTRLELDANYSAACNLEPEKMAKAVEDVGQSADKLLIIQKGRGVEGHKGGAVLKPGTPGDECVAGWLRGDPIASVAPQCQAAIDKLE